MRIFCKNTIVRSMT
ncbi:hypothetical protein X777_02529 [Ooceraea biroi]|uniref:Uncharacterized protein n=1 Tax=Ooceraea biroi TaxID=2015173 RepID=A0A026WMW6_OOCBI|nr:hypothetical protein X777_02529 [Ooceraea biroi]